MTTLIPKFDLMNGTTTPVGAINRPINQKLQESISVLDFGADATGNTDSTTAFQNAITAATSYKAALLVPEGTYKLTPSGTYGLSIDIGQMSLIGEGQVTLDFSSATCTYAVNIFSSLDYPYGHLFNSLNKVSGIYFKGGHVSGKNGLFMGSTTYVNNGQTNVENCSVGYFDTNIYFGDNSWRTVFYTCGSWNALTHNVNFASDNNAGEEQSFYHCFFFDGAGDFLVSTNDLKINFYSCSLGSMTLNVTGNVNYINFFSGNMETPNGNSNQYINVTGQENVISLFNTSITFDTPTNPLTIPLINIAATNSLLLYSVVWGNNPGYTPEVTTGIREYVAGAGRVLAVGSAWWPTSGGYNGVISSLMNEVYNGDFETGNMNGWTVTPYGTAGSTAVASATAKKNGNYGCLVTTVSGGGINVSQKFPCKPGQLTQAFCNIQIASGPSGSPYEFFQIIYTAADGTTISTVGDITNAVGQWEISGSNCCSYVPNGAVSATVNLNVQPGGDIVYFDDIVVNIG